MANAPESAEFEFHLRAFRGRREQGPGGRAGQFRQPRDEVLRRAFRRQGAEGGVYGAEEQALMRRARNAGQDVYGASRGDRISQGDGELRGDLGGGQRISHPRRAVDRDQDRSRPRRGGRAHGAQSRASLRASVLAGHSGHRAARSTTVSARRPRSSHGPTTPCRLLDQFSPGQVRFRSPDVLFAKVTDEQVAEWKTRFGGGDETSA